MSAPRTPVTFRRRVIITGLVLAAAELAVEFGVTGRVTIMGSAAPVICIVSGLVFLWSTRGRS